MIDLLNETAEVIYEEYLKAGKDESPRLYDRFLAVSNAVDLLNDQAQKIGEFEERQLKKGHWEARKRRRTYAGTPYKKYRCSVCGECVGQYEKSAFCPFCGADMRGEHE